MTSLQLANKALRLNLMNKPARLYRRIIKEVPRLLEIFELNHMGTNGARNKIKARFYEHKGLKDARVIQMLVHQGYIDLEDTMLQHKQKSHVMHLLEGPTGSEVQNIKLLDKDATVEEVFMHG